MNPFTVEVTNPETQETNSVKIVEYTPVIGKGKGNPKLQPEKLTTMTPDDVIKLFGKKKTMSVFILPRLKQLIAMFTKEATHKDDDTLETDEAIIQKQYADMFSTGSMRGETLTTLKNRLKEIAENELTVAIDLADTTDDWTEVKALRDEMKQIKIDIENKTIKKPVVEEDDAPAVAA